MQYFHIPPVLDNIEQLDCCKLLGVIFQFNFKTGSHIQFVRSQSQYAHRMYLLKLLRHQALPDAQLSVIANAIIVSRLFCALRACGRFLSVELVNRISSGGARRKK